VVWRNRDSPIPTPAKDLESRGANLAPVLPQVPAGSRCSHTVAVGAEVRSALIADGRGQDQKQGAERQMKFFPRLTAIAAATAAVLGSAGAAFAALGHPVPWQMDLQDAATPVMADISSFHTFLLWVIAAISVFVLALLVIVIVRFNARSNPSPSRTTHNTPIEIIWTIVPVVILAVIAVPSFRLLFLELDVPSRI